MKMLTPIAVLLTLALLETQIWAQAKPEMELHPYDYNGQSSSPQPIFDLESAMAEANANRDRYINHLIELGCSAESTREDVEFKLIDLIRSSGAAFDLDSLRYSRKLISAVVTFKQPEKEHSGYFLYRTIRPLRRAATKSQYQSLAGMRHVNIHVETAAEQTQQIAADLTELLWYKNVKSVKDEIQQAVKTKKLLNQQHAAIVAPSVGFYLNELQNLALINLLAELPSDCAAIEIIEYDKFSKEDGKIKVVPQYDAFLLEPDSKPKVIANWLSPIQPLIEINPTKISRFQLGSSEEINALIKAWRNELSAGSAKSGAGVVLGKKFEQLLSKLADTKRLYIIADGMFHAVPWAALPISNGQLLIEKCCVAELPFVEYLRQDMETGPTDQIASTLRTPPKTALFVHSVASELEHSNKVYRFLQSKLPSEQAITLSGDDASVDQVVHSMLDVKVVQFDTHGMYAANAFQQATKESLFPVSDLQNSLLFSSLELAPKKQDSKLNTNLLSSFLVSELDLSQMQLAVLAACETAAGESEFNEGRFGLMRAFHLAGCRDVVGSLWKVNDLATANFMIHFYTQLLNGRPPIDAMRDTQLAAYRGKINLGQGGNDRGPLRADALRNAAKQETEKLGTIPIEQWAAFQLSGAGRRKLEWSN